MNGLKIIVTDKNLTPLTVLDPETIIDPTVTQQWESGRHTLTLGYPLTGPKVERRVPLTLGDVWHMTLEEAETYDPDAE